MGVRLRRLRCDGTVLCRYSSFFPPSLSLSLSLPPAIKPAECVCGQALTQPAPLAITFATNHQLCHPMLQVWPHPVSVCPSVTQCCKCAKVRWAWLNGCGPLTMHSATALMTSRRCGKVRWAWPNGCGPDLEVGSLPSMLRLHSLGWLRTSVECVGEVLLLLLTAHRPEP
jgi:hypothetical protein